MRVAKQVLAVTVFLRLLMVQRIAIVELLAAHAHAPEPMILSARYVSSGDGRALRIPLRAIADATLHEMAFPDHRTVAHGPSLMLPRGYWITDHVAAFARFLAAHGIACSRLATARRVSVVVQDFVMDAADGRPRWQQDRHIEQWLPAGTLAVPAPADRARLLSTLLEPRASCSVFRYPAYRRLLERAPEFFILRDLPL